VDQTEIEALPLDQRQFLDLKEEFLDLYAALEATRRAAEALGRVAPVGSPVTRAHNALRAKLEAIKLALPAGYCKTCGCALQEGEESPECSNPFCLTRNSQ
jgi:hypothetical protein